MQVWQLWTLLMLCSTAVGLATANVWWGIVAASVGTTYVIAKHL